MTNYFVYLPDRLEHGPWECTATSVGHQNVLPGISYPPRHHPVDHHFTWENGRVLNAYQLQIRLHKAQDLLANTSRPVSEIAEISGFNTAFHLSSQFKNHVGLAPLTWRKRLAGTRNRSKL